MNRVIGYPGSLGIMALLAIIAASTLSCICVGLRCWGSPAAPAFPIEQLLVDESLFAEGWYQQGEPISRDLVSLGVDRIGVTFISHGGVALHDVYRCGSAARSVREYPGRIESWFSLREGWGPWSVPAELAYQSLVADQSRFACYTHQSSGVQTCQAVGQYEEYLVRFHTDMSPDYMTFAHLERILVAIDERMALYLAKDME